ncbi:hypothetical protein KJ973_03350, partial [Patescibacteria group bacterium]|nr:hypothetical protein [Patescibacteria group bacterium]
KPPVPTDTQLEIKNDILKIKTGGDVLTPKEAEAILKELDTPAPPRPTNKEGDYQIETGQNLEEIGVTIINNGSTTVENLDAGLIMINTGSTTVVEEVDDIEKNKEPTTTESAGLKLNKIDDDTTTVKMILENTENTFNFSAIDNNSNLHKIIEEYTNLKKENPVLQDAG